MPAGELRGSRAGDRDAAGEPRWGAWGLRVAGIGDAGGLLGPVPEWPVLRVSQERGDPVPARDLPRPDPGLDPVLGERLDLPLAGGRTLRLTRAPATAVVVGRDPVPAEHLVHPYLSSAVAVFSRWLGRETLHAGAVTVDGAAWSLLGGREAGKSSTLAWLAGRGVPVLTDDVLVVEEGTAYSGPRCLDLRASAAHRLGRGEPLGTVGTRERWRVALPGAPPATALGGHLLLEWGPTSVSRVPLPEALSALLSHRGMSPSPDPRRLLALASLPMLRLQRPRDWGALDGALEQALAAMRRV
ncbi:MAG: hypothetical protein ACRDYD_12625 [Acidimicrobiales bacterium]